MVSNFVFDAFSIFYYFFLLNVLFFGYFLFIFYFFKILFFLKFYFFLNLVLFFFKSVTDFGLNFRHFIIHRNPSIIMSNILIFVSPITFLTLIRFWRNRYRSKALDESCRSVPVSSKSDQY